MTYICSAIGTPLDDDDNLHEEGLRTHLQQQAHAGINGVLVAGTMGAMPLLKRETYRRLVRQSVRDWSGKGELLVGVGDTSFSRTRERIQFVNNLPVDGTVALTPYFFSYSQAELIAYFEALAKESRAPLYLYDLPQRTGIALAPETVLRLAEHPNIAGIKCSGDLSPARRLSDGLKGAKFRVILAQAPLIDVLLRAGYREHVDGIYSIVPQLAGGIAAAAARQDWETAAARTKQMTGVLSMLVKYGVFAAATALLNQSGIPGNIAPRPHLPLSSEAREQFLAEPAVRAALAYGKSQE